MKTILRIIFMMVLISIIGCSTENKTVMNTGHRGASAYAPENTISAMIKAVELNADCAELDAQETADGVIIILHDNTLKEQQEL